MQVDLIVGSQSRCTSIKDQKVPYYLYTKNGGFLENPEVGMGYESRTRSPPYKGGEL